MSNSQFHFNVKKTIDPKLDLMSNLNKDYLVVEGQDEALQQVYVANSYTNTSIINFNCPVPSMATMVNRIIYLKAKFSLTFQNVAAGTNPCTAASDALRDWPLSKLITTATATINGNQVSIQLGDVIQCFNRFYSWGSVKALQYSMTPAAQDRYATYAQGNGCINNPLAPIGNASIDGIPPRGAFIMEGLPVVTNAPGNGTTTLTYTVTEPIMLPPFVWNNDEALSLVGIQNLLFQFTLGSPARIWSHDPTTVPLMTAPTLSFVDPPELVFYYYNKRLPSIPKEVSYNYFNVIPYSVELGTLASGASTNSSVQTIVLNGMFHKLYIFARESDIVKNDTAAGKGICSTDTFLPISDLKITMGSKVVLSGTNQQGLYQISRANGYSGSWLDWTAQPSTDILGALPRQGFGPIIALEPKDMAAYSEFVVQGSALKTNLQIQCKVTNNRTAGVNASLWVLVCEEVVFSCSTEVAKCVQQLNVITPEDVLNAPLLHMPSAKRAFGASASHLGNGFLDDFKKGFSLPFNILREDILPTIGSVASIGKDILPLIGSFGKGKKPKRAGALVAGVKTGGSLVGGANDSYEGGSKLISRNELRNRLP